MENPKKLKVGWVTFTCSEDSTIIFTELLNDHFWEWKKILDFTYAKALRSENKLTNLDICFVEGAITSEEQALKLKKLREVSKRLIAVGACAVTGMPSAQRNLFDPQTTAEIQPILDKFSYRAKVSKVSDIVKVDAEVPGCPMDEKIFLELMDNVLKEFGVSNA